MEGRLASAPMVSPITQTFFLAWMVNFDFDVPVNFTNNESLLGELTDVAPVSMHF